MSTRLRGLALSCALSTLTLSFVSCDDDDDEDTTQEESPATVGDAGADAGRDAGRLDAAAGDAGAGEGGAAAGDAGEARRVEISAEEFEFTPDRIEAAPGQTLTVVLQNDGTVEHNIEFDLGDREPSLDSNVEPGETDTLTFTVPDQEGDYEFHCPVTGHRALGMTGTLVVTSP